MSQRPFSDKLAEEVIAAQLATIKLLEIRAAGVAALLEALRFYADPETYVAIGFFPDPPCGEFMEDFSETDTRWGVRPGKRARAAIDAVYATGTK